MTIFAAIQLTTSGAIGPNLIQAKTRMQEAVYDTDAKLVVLPENFACYPKDQKDFFTIAEKEGAGRIQDFLQETALYLDTWIVGGTIPLFTDKSDKLYNACIVYNNKGEQVARYNKMHLFDVDMPEAGMVCCESDVFHSGQDITVIDTPYGKVGLGISHDLRFPEFFRALRNKGAEIVCIPTAIPHAIGKVHWHVLVGARAIENQTFMVAANQYGVGDLGHDFHGDSMIIGPWGMIIDRLAEGVGFVHGDVDVIRAQILREEFPVWNHRKFK